LLNAALTAASQTDGDVDPTVGAAMVALGYGGDIATIGRGRRLAASIITPAIWSMVTLDDRVVTVPPGILLDLGATAKAVAADQCALHAHDVTGSGVLVNLGGDIATAGSAPDGGLHTNWTQCDGRGLCTELLPALLIRDDWGYPLPRNGSREPAIPPGDVNTARIAVDRCPRLALSLVSRTEP
jgi:thiamine biosynthesis lipoprotein